MDTHFAIDTLIVDDNIEFREILKTLFAHHFPEMSVSEAGSCAEAWQQIVDGHPHLIFSDINLHDENGLKLTWRIRQSYPDVVVVVMTACDGPEYREAAFARGADCFVPKFTATLADILTLVKSFETGQYPKWDLGADYLNPSPPGHPWK